MITICINIKDEDYNRVINLIDILLNEAGIEHELFVEGNNAKS